jgi:hypothetical protein
LTSLRIKSKDYHDKAKGCSVRYIIKKYRLIDFNADKEAVVKKINVFRTNYIRENKNFEESQHSGSGTDEICVPTLWY